MPNCGEYQPAETASIRGRRTSNATTIADIVNAIDPRPQDSIVEIGPGRAALTDALLSRFGQIRAGQMRAIEIDGQVLDLAGGDIALPRPALVVVGRNRDSQRRAFQWAVVVDEEQVAVL